MEYILYRSDGFLKRRRKLRSAICMVISSVTSTRRREGCLLGMGYFGTFTDRGLILFVYLVLVC